MTAVTLAAATAFEENPWARAWRRLKRRKGAMAALVVVVLLILVAVLAPWIAPYDPTATSFTQVRKPPSWAHWLGTDEVGRDVLSRVIFGARASLSAGLVSVSIAVGAGVPLGLLAGYAGGWIDSVLSRIVDAMLAIPFLILAIALAAFLGPSLGNAMIAIGVTATPVFVRLTRGQTLGAKVEDYVEAARAVGNPHWRIRIGASRCATCCPTSCRHCWCRPLSPSPARSSPRRRSVSSGSASSPRPRRGAAC
jgi:peptide/nickel transport system permease protein